jgi:hypothetical protein
MLELIRDDPRLAPGVADQVPAAAGGDDPGRGTRLKVPFTSGILADDLLDVPELGVHLHDRLQRSDPVRRRLADPHHPSRRHVVEVPR